MNNRNARRAGHLGDCRVLALERLQPRRTAASTASQQPAPANAVATHPTHGPGSGPDQRTATPPGKNSRSISRRLRKAWVLVSICTSIHAFLCQICHGLHRSLRLRIQVGNFEAACRMIEATVGVGVLPSGFAELRTRSGRAAC